MAKDNRREERRARKQKKAEDKKLMDAANKKAESITSTKTKKQKVDKKTGLTETPSPKNDQTITNAAQEQKDYNQRQKDLKKSKKITSVTKKIPTTDDGRIIKSDEARGGMYVSDEVATNAQSERLYKGGKDVTGIESSGEVKKILAEIENPEKENLGDLDPDFADQSSPVPGESDKRKPSHRKARRQNKRYYNKLEKSEEQKRNQEARNITENLKEEAKATSPNADVLLEKLEVASELDRQVKREEKEQKKAKKKIERIDRKTGGILGVLSSLVPPEMKDGLTNLKPKDLVELASKFGIEDTEGDRRGGKNSMASGYIDTIEKLGVQDYFPNAGQSIAVGTFSGARIGSETIYAGGGANLPLGLYDARKRALKAKFGATQKTMNKLADFTKLPPTYRRDVQDGLGARYNEIQADNTLSPQEKATKLEGLSAIVDEITYAYNSAKSIYNVQLGNDGDKLYIGKAQSKDINDILGNLMDTEMLEKYMSGDNKYNMAKDAVEKLQFHKNLLQDVEEVATQMKDFKKTANVDAYLNSLNVNDRTKLDSLLAQEDKSEFTNSVYFTNMKNYYSKDVDQLFDDNFLDDEGNLRPEYSEEQKEKGKRYLNDMLDPYYEQEVIQIATGNAAKGRLAIDKELNKFIFQEQFKQERDEFPSIMSGADPAKGLEAYGTPVVSNIGGKEVISVERDVKFADFYQDKSNYLRPGTSGINEIKIRVTSKSTGEDYLMTPAQLKDLGVNKYKATDGGADIKQQDLDYLNDSTKVLMTKNIVTPAYMDSNNAIIGVDSNLSNQGSYKSSSNKVSMYEDVGRPMYMEVYIDRVDGKSKKREIGLPFTIQGKPVMNTTGNAQKNDNAYTSQQSKERRLDK
tara:strand:+ start:730 stop:3318 length:2589 start_codon:yes stop_codon:yes gene_type:complete